VTITNASNTDSWDRLMWEDEQYISSTAIYNIQDLVIDVTTFPPLSPTLPSCKYPFAFAVPNLGWWNAHL
jgi:hypothetical protein